MAIAFVNGTTNNDAGPVNPFAAAAQNHTTGNTIIVFTSNYTVGAVRSVSGVADTALNSYVKAGGDYGGDANHRMECWIAHNVTGNASNVVTVTFSGGAGFAVIGVIQYSGLHASAAYDASATGQQSTSDPLVSGSVSTSTDDQIVLGWFIAFSPPEALATTGSSTLRVEAGGGGAVDNSAIFERIAATAGSYTVSADIIGPTGAQDYSIIARSFKAASGGGELPPVLGNCLYMMP